MTIHEFIRVTWRQYKYSHGSVYNAIRPRLVCKDGFSMSVQASDGHYCHPRRDEPPYTELEVGFPSEAEPHLLKHAEEQDRPTKTVYPYVPTTLIEGIIEKHGGIDIEETFKTPYIEELP